jgi:hypothetical protein
MIAPAGTTRSDLTVRLGAWHAETDFTLTVPPGWEVFRADPADAPEMTEQEIHDAFAKPIGTPTLRDLAAGKRTAVVAVDDLTRPTPAHRFLPLVIDELTRGGIAEDRVHILMGAAAHRPMDESELSRKLGPAIAARFKPVMHDFMGPDIQYFGRIQGGPVYLNRHFLDADLRICIGAAVPHGEAGFGGGAKMVVPGLAGRLTIAHFHGSLPARKAGCLEAPAGRLDRRAWSEAVASAVGVGAVVCAVVNSSRQLAGLYVGDVVEAHRAAARHACRVGRTVVPSTVSRAVDAVLVNAYPLDTDPIQMGKSVSLAGGLAPKLTVVLNAASDGIFYHGMGMGSGVSAKRLLRNVPRWLFSPASHRAFFLGAKQVLHGPTLAARLAYFSLNHLAYSEFQNGEGRRSPHEPAEMIDEDASNVLVFSQRFPTWGLARKFRGQARLYRRWNDLAAVLERRMPTARAVLLPCAPLQLLEIQ